MGKHYNHQPAPQVEEVEVAQPVIEEPVEDAEPVVEESVAPPAPAPVTGVVVDCVRLNVRSAPSTNATARCAIDCGSKVTIDMDKSKNDWYSVCTEAGVTGFCMKKYVEISQ